VITPENVDTSGMSITKTDKRPPKYANAINYFIFKMATGIENVDGIEEDNSIYATRTQLQEFKNNPRKLTEITRNFIRSRIHVSPESVSELPIPNFAKDYLLGVLDLPFY
jgi:hypothetical protein